MDELWWIRAGQLATVRRSRNGGRNIYHSFRPAFVSANPYQQAADHGVKPIGAIAHYVTAELDAGPIIEIAAESGF
jgi:formyltetrahydrofolate hydrolase